MGGMALYLQLRERYPRNPKGGATLIDSPKRNGNHSETMFRLKLLLTRHAFTLRDFNAWKLTIAETRIWQ